MSSPREINKAIANHGYWKVRLHEAIETGKSEWSAEYVCNDKLCEFGKWFHFLPTPEKSSEYWQKVQPLHARFHSQAGKILKMALEGQKEEAIALMTDHNGEFVKTSSDLTHTLYEWKKAVS